MPITSLSPVAVSAPNQAYDRLALRGSLNVRLVDEAVSSGSFALHCTRYRKPESGVFDACGLVGSGEVGAVVECGSGNDALLTTLGLIVRDYLGVTGDADCQIQFAWHVVDGDLIGMARAEAVPVVAGVRNEEGKVEKATPNTAELAAEDAFFALKFGQLLAAIQQFAVAKGW